MSLLGRGRILLASAVGVGCTGIYLGLDKTSNRKIALDRKYCEQIPFPKLGFPRVLAAYDGNFFRRNLRDAKDRIRQAGFKLPDDFTPCLTITNYDDYMVVYDKEHKVPVFTFEALSTEHLKNNIDEPDWHNTSLRFTGTYKDFLDTQYRKGHMAAKGFHLHDEVVLRQSMNMINISPVVHWFKVGIWAALEDFTREQLNDTGDVCVITGAVLDKCNPIKIGRNCVHVPKALYKIIIVNVPASSGKEAHYKVYPFIIPNIDVYVDKDNPKETLDFYLDTVTGIEELSGYTFMCPPNKRPRKKVELAKPKVVPKPKKEEKKECSIKIDCRSKDIESNKDPDKTLDRCITPEAAKAKPPRKKRRRKCGEEEEEEPEVVEDVVIEEDEDKDVAVIFPKSTQKEEKCAHTKRKPII